MTRSFPPVQSTERVILREFTLDDADDLFALDSDPRVMRYIGDGQTATRADVDTLLPKAIARYVRHPGMGSFHATLRETGRFIGWCSVKHAGESPDVEVGYRLCFDAWGKGLATEMARAMLARGFDTIGLERIIGVTHPDNLASQHVLRKCGLEDLGWGHYYDRDLRLFAIQRSQWERR